MTCHFFVPQETQDLGVVQQHHLTHASVRKKMSGYKRGREAQEQNAAASLRENCDRRNLGLQGYTLVAQTARTEHGGTDERIY